MDVCGDYFEKHGCCFYTIRMCEGFDDAFGSAHFMNELTRSQQLSKYLLRIITIAAIHSFIHNNCNLE